jgi:putative transposase
VRRAAVQFCVEQFDISERRACRLLRAHRSTQRYRPHRPRREALRARLIALAEQRRRFGYKRLHVLLRREGHRVNHKLVYRLYTEEKLGLRRRRRKRLSRVRRAAVQPPTRPNERWSMDFVSDCLTDKRRIRALNIVDGFTRECLAIVVDTSINGVRVARALQELLAQRDKPERIVVDNGPEFAGRALDAWAYDAGVHLHFITPGRPTENAYVESFNGKFRLECLDEHCFRDMADARATIETWRRDYNEWRPHSSIGDLAPSEFAATWRPRTTPQPDFIQPC